MNNDDDFTVEEFVLAKMSWDKNGNTISKEVITKTVNIMENDIVYDEDEKEVK